jgi:hypothetical protein
MMSKVGEYLGFEGREGCGEYLRAKTKWRCFGHKCKISSHRLLPEKIATGTVGFENSKETKIVGLG